MRLAPLLLAALALTTACTTADDGPAAAVSDAEARQAVQRTYEVAARGNPKELDELCSEEGGCGPMTSPLSARLDTVPEEPPRERCLVRLPPLTGQQGAKVLVLEGTDGKGKPYLTHALVERDGDRVHLHEAAFWVGMRYDSIQRGRSWSGTGTEDHEQQAAQALRACTDTAAWVREVTGT